MNIQIKKEIPIIGAGPGGLFAAIRLKDNGLNPVVYEAKSTVGLRFHGDFQGLENWSTVWNPVDFLKENGVDLTFRCVPFYGGLFYAPDYIQRKIVTSDPMFYLVRRGNFEDTLDTHLLRQVLERNIPVKFNTRITEIPKGAISSTGPRKFNMIAKGFTFETDLPDSAIGIVDDSLAPKGYVYILIQNGIGTFSTVIYQEFKKIDYFSNLAWKKSLELVPNLNARNVKPFGGFGNCMLKRKPFPDYYFPIGESAGYQDFLFGFGIKFSLISAYCAAESILTGESYEKLAQKHIDPIHQVSIANRYLYEFLGNKGYNFVMGKVGLSRNPLNRLKQQFKFNFAKQLIYPFAVHSLTEKLERELK